MSNSDFLDARPIIVAIAGPNGAGKSTFMRAYLQQADLLFVNADVLAEELDTDPYAAARLADGMRRALVQRGESFAFETVLSDPVGDKVAFLEQAALQGYDVVLFFIGLASAEQSVERVGLRVLRGGHDVPADKLLSRFPRTMSNLELALVRLPHVRIYDNSDLKNPFRRVADVDFGQISNLNDPLPDWLRPLLP